MKWKRSDNNYFVASVGRSGIYTHTGKAPLSDTYINIYGARYNWHFTIRSKHMNDNLIIFHEKFRTLRAAKSAASLMIFVQLLLDIDSKLFRSDNESYFIRRVEPLKSFHNRSRFSRFHEIEQNPYCVDGKCTWDKNAC